MNKCTKSIKFRSYQGKNDFNVETMTAADLNRTQPVAGNKLCGSVFPSGREENRCCSVVHWNHFIKLMVFLSHDFRVTRIDDIQDYAFQEFCLSSLVSEAFQNNVGSKGCC